MRDDFCNSDRRSSLSVLLVTLNASNKSFGRRQESSSEGIFSSSVLPRKEKKTDSFLKRHLLITLNAERVVYDDLMLKTHQCV